MNARSKGRAVREGAEVISIDPGQIMVPKRIGFLFEEKVISLGRMMAVDGQRDPIKVARNMPSKSVEKCLAEGIQPWRLVVGMHRLQGCLLEGLNVLAIEVKGKPEELAELEASENIDRRDIGPLEKAKFVAAIADAARARVAAEHGEDLSQQQMAIKSRWLRAKEREAGLKGLESAIQEEADDTCSQSERVYGWQQSVRDAFGLGRTQTWQFIKLYRMLVEPFPDFAEPLAKHPVVGENLSQLLKIASQQDENVRRRVIEALLADDALNADEAIQQFGATARSAPKEPLDPTRKHKDAIRNNWDRLAHRKMQFIPTFASWLTRPQALAMQDAVAQRLSELGDGDE